MANTKYQVTFLPWANIGEEISIGPVKFIPYKKLKECNFSSKNRLIYNWLDKYFSRHVDHKNKPVDSITICSIGKPDFRPLDKEDIELIQNTANALYFAFVYNNLLSLTKEVENAQIFEVITQNFKSDFKSISLENDKITPLNNAIFSKPLSFNPNNLMLNNFDQEVLKGFERLIKNENNELKNRIFRSLQWFWLCHIWRDYFSDLIKIVMMATAFEILLELSRSSKKKDFAHKLDEKIATNAFKKKERKISYSLAGWWGWDFYNLRNKIVHGDKIAEEELIYIEKEPRVDENGYWHNPLVITYLMVADAIFCELILLELLKSKMSKFNNLHEELGWIESKKNIPGFKIETNVYGYDKE